MTPNVKDRACAKEHEHVEWENKEIVLVKDPKEKKKDGKVGVGLLEERMQEAQKVGPGAGNLIIIHLIQRIRKKGRCENDLKIGFNLGFSGGNRGTKVGPIKT